MCSDLLALLANVQRPVSPASRPYMLGGVEVYEYKIPPGADLVGVNLSRASLRGTDLTEANLQGTDLTEE